MMSYIDTMSMDELKVRVAELEQEVKRLREEIENWRREAQYKENERVRLQELADSRLGKVKALKAIRNKLGAENERLRAEAQVCEAEHWDRGNVEQLQGENEQLRVEKAEWQAEER